MENLMSKYDISIEELKNIINDDHLIMDDCEGMENCSIIKNMARIIIDISQKPVMTVWEGSMPESNGKKNFTVILHRKGECISEGRTIYRSEYPDRARYEADHMRYLLSERTEYVNIRDYDFNKHSGYQPIDK